MGTGSSTSHWANSPAPQGRQPGHRWAARHTNQTTNGGSCKRSFWRESASENRDWAKSKSSKTTAERSAIGNQQKLVDPSSGGRKRIQEGRPLNLP
jgi:hypothetical protein